MPITILIVDDHMIFRTGLRLLLDEETDTQVVGEADDGLAAVEQVQALCPDVVVMDISMPGMNGIDATRRILSVAPDTKVMALSAHGDGRHIEEMLRAGARGYLLKESAPEELVDGIRSVAGGEVYLGASVKDVVVHGYMDHLAEQSSQTASETADDSERELLLHTKLHRTRLSPRSVQRPRLIEQLEQGFDRSLTLVAAPAGYGKSTLVSQWLEASDQPSAWLALDESDNDLRLFLIYLIAAIETRFPSLLPKSSAMVQATDLPPLHILVGTLTNELEQAPERFILVLDDYHQIIAPEIHEFVNRLLRYPSPTLHLVVATRTDPMLDLLQLRAYQQMAELRADALCFTVDETAAFLQQIVSCPVAGGVAASLTDKVEGWVMGLNLITRSIRDVAQLNDLSVSLPGERQTLAYLVAEALARQPQMVQACLLKTSILDRFCASLCERVCSPSDDGEGASLSGEQFVEWLTDRQLFAVSLDQGRRWFRYHHLFRELLQSQLRTFMTDDELALLHRRASLWYAEEGLVEEAIRHALAGGDISAAARIVEQNRLSTLQTDESYTLARWLGLLPDEIRQQRPGLLLAQAHILYRATRIGDIPPILQRLQSLLADKVHREAEPLLLAETSHFQGVVAFFQGDSVGAKTFLNDAVTLLPANADDILRGQFEYWLALAHYLNGDKETAIRKLNEGIRSRGAGDGLIRSRLIFGLGFTHMLANEWNQVYQTGLRLKQLSSASNFALGSSWANYLIGYAGLQHYDLEAARQHLNLVVESRYIANARAGVDAMVGLALSLQFLGKEDEADDVLARAREFAAWTSGSGNAEIVRSGAARLALLRGDHAAAERWQRVFSESTSLPPMLFFCENPQITECRVLIALGGRDNLERAAAKLDTLQTANRNRHNISQMTEIGILQAMVRLRQKRVEDALHLLNKVIALATPGGLIRPFVEAGKPMVQLLTRLKKQVGAGNGSDQVDVIFAIDQILSAWSIFVAAEAPRPQTHVAEPLTQRELQALRLLATELEPNEIAAEMVVTVATVRTYCKRIYSKLDVHSRTEAVYRAKDLGLV